MDGDRAPVPAAAPSRARGDADPRGCDCHFHVFTADTPPAPGARYRPGYDAPLERWQVSAGAAGITRGVLVQPSFLGTDNTVLLRTIGRADGRLAGVAVVDPAIPFDAMQRLATRGVCAVRWNLLGHPDPVAAVQAHRAGWFDDLLRLGWHVEIHQDDGGLPAILAAIPAALPVVLDHFGRPGAARSDDPTFTSAARRAGPTWVKLSAPYRNAGRDPGRLVATWRDLIGPSRLLWGSDWPWTNHESGRDYDTCLADLGRWMPDPHDRHEVLVANPARCYRFHTKEIER